MKAERHQTGGLPHDGTETEHQSGGEIPRQRDGFFAEDDPERQGNRKMHSGVLPQRLTRDRPHAGGEEIEEHEHKGPSWRREAAEHRPENEGRKYFNDGGDDVPAVHEKA